MHPAGAHDKVLRLAPAVDADLRVETVGGVGGPALGWRDRDPGERELSRAEAGESGGRVGGPGGAAAKLGMKRTTLQAKMQKLGIGTRGQ